MNSTLHTYKNQPQTQSGHTFSAKEKDDETGYSYFGARYYDSELSVWLSVDPLAGKYPSMSPFMYCAGNPVILKDPDGKKIIFVNGHFQDNWIGRNFLGASKTGRDYWGNGFIQAAQKFFNDNSSVTNSNFVDGSSSFGADMSGQDRYNAGYNFAKENIGMLTSDLKKDETFKMVTHSEGAAYGAGMAQYLIENGYTVETIVHLSADEGDEFSTPKAPTTYQLGFYGDWVTGNLKINGVDKSGIASTNLSWKYVHGSTRNASVFSILSDLVTVQFHDNIIMNGATSNTYQTQTPGTTPNGTNFIKINGYLMCEDGKR